MGVGAIRASQLQSPVPVVITLVPPRRRHRRRATAPALLVLEWLVLTTLGAVALALVAA